MPRVPNFNFDAGYKDVFLSALEMVSHSLAQSTRSGVDEKIEVVYIPEKEGSEKGNGLLQCRVKKTVERGALRLHPTGGTFIHTENVTERKIAEKELEHARDCYIRGCEVSCGIKRTSFRHTDNFILYSPMCKKPLAEQRDNGKVTVNQIPAFWAAMLAGRDTTKMVNMEVNMEEYQIPTPLMKNHGGFHYSVRILE